jgi:hypothetical protein
MEKSPIPNPEAWAVPGLTAITQTSVGCGLGLLLAGKMGRRVQKITAVVLLSVGLASTLPLVLGVCFKRWNRPESDRGMRKRLESIREGSGFSEDAELY